MTHTTWLHAKCILIKLTPIAIGMIAFLLIVGKSVLDVGNIGWLQTGDPAQHYLGWSFFRNSEWEFPLGLNPDFGLEISNGIIYSDSNPLFALVFKIFSPLLPVTFQYFGIWLLVCFILQSYFAYKIISLISESWIVCVSGTLLFAFSPPMMARLFGHLSLVGHFFVLASIYLVLNAKIKHRLLMWALLLPMSSMVHSYIFVMCFFVWLADLVDRHRNKRLAVGAVFIEPVVVMCSVLISCWQVGYFSIHDGVAAGGYGYYRMNLLSLIDSNGWSYLLHDFNTSPGDSEGFAYLGLGSLFIFIIALWSLSLRDQRKLLLDFINLHKSLFVISVGLTLYAITNKVGIGSLDFSIGLPHFIIKLANIFRASGRFFWVVYYLIVIYSIWSVVRLFGRKSALVFMIAAAAQIVDTSAMYQGYIHERFNSESSSTWRSNMSSPFWKSAALKYKKIRWIKPDYVGPHWQELSAYAASNNLSTDAVYLARVSKSSWEKLNNMAVSTVLSGHYQPDSLYILDDSYFKLAVNSIDPDKDLLARVNGFNVLAPNWKTKTCTDCFHVDSIRYIDVLRNVSLGKSLSFGTDGEGVPYLLNGWSAPEAWGVWSDGKIASLAIPYLEPNFTNIIIDVAPFFYANQHRQKVEVLINGERSDVLEFKQNGDHKVVLNIAKDKLLGKHLLVIDFKFYSAVSPEAVGLSDDSRLLSLGLKSMVIH